LQVAGVLAVAAEVVAIAHTLWQRVERMPGQTADPFLSISPVSNLCLS